MQERKPHILYMVGWFYPDSVGGSEHYVYMLARNIQAQGWDVTIAAPAPDEKELHYNYKGIPVYRYPVTLRPDLAEIRVDKPPRYFEVFANWLKELNPDLVHVHSRTRGCGFFHIRHIKQMGIHVILTIHTADFMCMGGTSMLWGISPCDGKLNVYRCAACRLKNEGMPWPLAVALSRIPIFLANAVKKIPARWATCLAMVQIFIDKRERDRQIFECVDKIVVVAKWLFKVLVLNGIPEEKIFYSLHGLPPAQTDYKKSYPPEEYKPLRIGFIGRFNKIKGPNVLIKAMKRLPLDIKVELRLYGRVNSEEDKKYLLCIKRGAGSDQRIKFLGELTQENYREAMDSMDIMAVPSLWLETGPFVILEAFRAGIPVIGSNAGGIADLVVDGVNGALVETGNVRNWAEAIMRIYNNPRLIRDWAGGITPVRNIQDVSIEMLGLYKELLNLT